MKKKILLLSLLIAPLGLAVAGCKEETPGSGNNPNEKQHKLRETYSFDGNYHWQDCIDCYDLFNRGLHTWNSGEVTKAATDNEEGIKTYTCTVCSATKTETIPSLSSGHTHTWGNEYSSSVDYHWKACSGCDDVFDKNFHDWDKGKVTKLATEAEEGVKTLTCTVCGRTKTESIPKAGTGHVHVWRDTWKYDENQHWKTCGGCPAKTDYSEHDWDDGVVTKDPTDFDTGIRTLTCTVCGATKEVEIPADFSLHTHSWNTGEITKPATATEEGEKTFTCTTCHETKKEAIPKISGEHTHEWDAGKVTTQPTETEEGVKTFTCTTCGQTKTESIAPVGGGTKLVDGYVMVDSIKDVDHLYIVSSSDGMSYNAMTAETKGEELPWYLVYAVTDFEISKTGYVEMEANGEEYTFTKQSDGSYTIQAKNGNYVYSYVDGTHYSIGLCDTTTAPKSGTIYWNITKDGNGFVVQGTTTQVYLSQYLSFCGNKQKPGFPIYLFEKGKVLVEIGGGGGSGGDIGGTIAEDSRWNLDFTQYGYTFRDTLATLIRAKVKTKTNYKACLGIGQSAAAKDSGYVPFYHDDVHSKTESANREHTWPNSRGGGSSSGGDEIEEDPYMVRPTLSKENSDRKNYFYGVGTNEWDPASCGFEGARGESARVIFYVATKYGKTHGLSLSNNPGDATNKKTMGTLKYLIEWNRKYPVTDMEKQINNNLEKAGFGRNPFVDHPEYAEFIWTTSGVQTAVPNIDVGGTGTGGTTGGNTGGSTGGNTGGNTGGQDVPPITYDYSLISDVNSLDGKTAYIVSSKEGNGYYAMTDEPTESSKPFYIKGVSATLNTDKSSCNIDGDAIAFKFEKQADGSFTICSSKGAYLYNYIDGSHNSITLSDTSKGTKYWTITKENDAFVVKSSTLNVYLEYYGRFCGYSSKPSIPIYLYDAVKATASA